MARVVVREVNRRTERTRTRSDRQRSHHAVFFPRAESVYFLCEHDTRQMRTTSRWNRTVHVKDSHTRVMLSTQQQSITAAEWIHFFADSTFFTQCFTCCSGLSTSFRCVFHLSGVVYFTVQLSGVTLPPLRNSRHTRDTTRFSSLV